MPVEMPRNPCPGDRSDVEADVEAVGLHPGLDPPAPGNELRLEIEELVAVEVGECGPVVERGNEEMAVGIRETVENHDARAGSHDDPQLAVVLGGG
jgi:hypothetical protein